MVSQPKIDYINRLVDESLSKGDDSIELKGKFIGDEGIEALVQSSDLSSIEDLDLSNNKIFKIRDLSSFKSLTNLNLSNNRIQEIGNSLLQLKKMTLKSILEELKKTSVYLKKQK